MKIVVAPDSFMGSLSAREAAAVIGHEFRSVWPQAEIIELRQAAEGSDLNGMRIRATGF